MLLLMLAQACRLQFGQVLAGFVWYDELFVARVVGLGPGAGCADLQGFLVEAAGLSIGLLFLGVQRWGWLG